MYHYIYAHVYMCLCVSINLLVSFDISFSRVKS